MNNILLADKKTIKEYDVHEYKEYSGRQAT